jgi:hypothetical protein
MLYQLSYASVPLFCFTCGQLPAKPRFSWVQLLNLMNPHLILTENRNSTARRTLAGVQFDITLQPKR